jgi:hypothetical protein
MGLEELLLAGGSLLASGFCGMYAGSKSYPNYLLSAVALSLSIFCGFAVAGPIVAQTLMALYVTYAMPYLGIAMSLMLAQIFACLSIGLIFLIGRAFVRAVRGE